MINDPLLNSKRLPPRMHNGLVLRPELLLRLDEDMQRKLMLPTAPTGFGKTTLFGMWLRQRGTSWCMGDAGCE